jgi:hypothetical protein
MNIDEFMENKMNINSVFNGSISGISFTNQALFETVLSVTRAMLEKFDDMRNVEHFVSVLTNCTNKAIYKYETQKLKDYQPLTKIEVLSYKAIETILLTDIKYTDDHLENVRFYLPDIDDDSFTLLNELIKDKTFNSNKLSKVQTEIVKRDNLFTVDEIEDWLAGKITNDNSNDTISFYYNLINKQLKEEGHI